LIDRIRTARSRRGLTKALFPQIVGQQQGKVSVRETAGDLSVPVEEVRALTFGSSL